MADINIKNKKAGYEYHLIDKYVAGLQLLGTEIKSIRDGKASIQEAYCRFEGDELFVRNMNITEYKLGTHNNHEPLRPRKLLLQRRELTKLQKSVKEKGLTIVPLRLFISERGHAKLEISLAKGKNVHDKRQDIKEKDLRRDLDRDLK